MIEEIRRFLIELRIRGISVDVRTSITVAYIVNEFAQGNTSFLEKIHSGDKTDKYIRPSGNENNVLGLFKLIGILVCKSNRDNEIFWTQYSYWKSAYRSTDINDPKYDPFKSEHVRIRKLIFAALLIIAVITIIFSLALLYLTLRLEKNISFKSISEIASKEFFLNAAADTYSWIGVFLETYAINMVPLAIPFIIWKFRSNSSRALARKLLKRNPKNVDVTIRGLKRELSNKDSFLLFCNKIKRKGIKRSTKIDYKKSIQKAINSPPNNELIYKNRINAKHDLVILVDRSTRYDLIRSYVQMIQVNLAKGGLYIIRYEFKGNSNAYYEFHPNSSNVKQIVDIDSLLTDIHDKDILLFADSMTLLDLQMQKEINWLGRLAERNSIIVMDTNVLDSNYPRKILNSRGYYVQDATSSGFLAMAR